MRLTDTVSYDVDVGSLNIRDKHVCTFLDSGLSVPVCSTAVCVPTHVVYGVLLATWTYSMHLAGGGEKRGLYSVAVPSPERRSRMLCTS